MHRLVSRSQSGASPGTPVRQSGKFFSPAGQPTNPIRRNFQSGGVSAPVRHRAKKTAPSTIQVTSASPADGPIRRLGALGPWDPGTMGPWDPGTLGPWDRHRPTWHEAVHAQPNRKEEQQQLTSGSCVGLALPSPVDPSPVDPQSGGYPVRWIPSPVARQAWRTGLRLPRKTKRMGPQKL